MQATITAFQSVDNPQRHQLGGWRFKFKRDTAVLSTTDKPVEAPTASFSTTLTPGSYSATAQRLNNFGQPIGPEVASDPVVVAGPEQFDAPLTVTISL
jgi:hypothetical protein